MVTWALLLEKVACELRLGGSVGGGAVDVYRNTPGRRGQWVQMPWQELGLLEEPQRPGWSVVS